jgi:hypothetical protein
MKEGNQAMRKKVTLTLMTAALLISTAAVPGAAFAKEHSGNKKGIENALGHVKNERAREVLERNLERKRAKEEAKEERKKNKHEWTEQEIVAEDKEELEIEFQGSDDEDAVTLPLEELPLEGENGSTITWASSHPAILSADGQTLNRPAYGSGDVTVTLTATLTYGSASDTKEFEVVVKQLMTDAQKVAADREALAIGYAAGNSAAVVTAPLTLPATGANGSSITWTSSIPSVISSDGKTVVRPAAGAGDISVVLIAQITSGAAIEVKTFTVTVKQQLNDQQKVAADKEALAIGFATGNSYTSVTGPIALAATGTYGSSITWTSTNPSVISADGKTVVRPAAGAGDVNVVLLAHITAGSFTDVKSFTVTVKQQLNDQQKVAADKEALAIGFAGSDSATQVTQAITLPTAGVNGSSIFWWSNTPGVISHDGKLVQRPAAGAGDATVTLTATIISNSAVDTKAFTVTVKQR